TEGTSDGFYIIAALRGGDGVIADFEIVDCNEPGAGYFGVRREQLLGMRLQSRAHEPYFRDLIHNYRAAMQSGFSEEEIELPEGNPFKLRWIRRRLVRSGDRLAVTLQDISTAKEHERDLRRLANEDGLTGLPNRCLLNQLVDQGLAEAKRQGTHGALMVIDISRIGSISDTLGHEVGDQLVIAIGQLFRGALRDADILARVDNSKFVVALLHIEKREHAANVAQKLLNLLEAPINIDAHALHVGASIGITVYPEDGLEAPALFRFADVAVAKAAQTIESTFLFYRE
ncbi:MAG: sensor domain-containing diguanylate cyclase, partial [Janthinobacterium sp.]